MSYATVSFSFIRQAGHCMVGWRSLSRIVCLAICLIAVPAFAQQLSRADEAKIRDAIRMRDEAYYADNFEEAYRLGIDVLKLAESLSAADGLLVADSKVRIAMILDKLDRIDEAATNYEQACPVFLAKASDQDTRPGLCQHAQAMVLLKLGRAVEAKPIYESAIQRLTATMPGERAAAATFALAERLEETRIDDEAVKYFEIAANEFVTSDPKQVDFAVTAYTQMAELHGRLGLTKDKASDFRKAIDLLSASTPRNDARIATLQFQLADALIAAGEFDEALTLLEEVKSALAVVSVHGHTGPEAVLSRIAGLQIRTGVPRDAIATLREALEFAAKNPASERRSKTVQFGEEFLDDAEVNKNYSQARQFIDEIATFDDKFYEEWKSGSAKSAELQGVFGIISNRIAVYQLNRSEFSSAHKILLRSLDRTREIFGPDSSQEIEILERLSAQALTQQDPWTAERYIKSAIAISEKIPGEYSELYWGYALVLRQVGPDDLASKMMDRSLKMKEEKEGLSAGLLLRQSQRLSDKGDLREARIVAELAYLKDPDSPTLVSHLASLYAKEKNWKQAVEAAKRAVDMRVQRYGSFHINTAAARYSLGQIYHEAGQSKQAFDQFLQCSAIFAGAVTDFEPQFSTAELRLVLPALIDSWRSALISMSSEYADVGQL
jgi:tetratricopeptide (TPR) repeat protein